MIDKIIYILANILMIVEAGVLVFLIRAWLNAKRSCTKTDKEIEK